MNSNRLVGLTFGLGSWQATASSACHQNAAPTYPVSPLAAPPATPHPLATLPPSLRHLPLHTSLLLTQTAKSVASCMWLRARATGREQMRTRVEALALALAGGHMFLLFRAAPRLVVHALIGTACSDWCEVVVGLPREVLKHAQNMHDRGHVGTSCLGSSCLPGLHSQSRQLPACLACTLNLRFLPFTIPISGCGSEHLGPGASKEKEMDDDEDDDER